MFVELPVVVSGVAVGLCGLVLSMPGVVVVGVVCAVVVGVVVGVRFTGGVLGTRQARECDDVDDLGFDVGGLEHRRHEAVVSAAVDDDEVSLGEAEPVPGRRLVGVRVLIGIVDDRRDVRGVPGDRGDDVGVDVRRGDDRELGRIAALPAAAPAEDQAGDETDRPGGEEVSGQAHGGPFVSSR